MNFELKFFLNKDISPGSVDSLRTQIEEVIAAAIDEKQLDIPDAEIHDYAVTPTTESGFLD